MFQIDLITKLEIKVCSPKLASDAAQVKRLKYWNRPVSAILQNSLKKVFFFPDFPA
jgi:hypothetical protein